MLQQAQSFYQDHKTSFEEDFRIRIHRALTWFKKASELDEETSLDLKFITLWIGFNAAYGKDLPALDRTGEKYTFKAFLDKILSLDKEEYLASVVRGKYAMRMSFLVENKFTFQRFWDYYNGDPKAENWALSFEKSQKKLSACRIDGDLSTLLSIVFDRLYTLRNQLFHGGATYGSKLNRQSLEDCVGFMGDLFAALLLVMMQSYPSDHDWGRLFYAPIKE